MKPRFPRRWAIAGLVTISLTVSVRAQPTTSYLVQRVVDGDTVVLDQIGTVRLIGVDTPETVDPRKPVQAFGVEASRFLTSMLSGKSVRLDYDHDRTDKYRRTLAYLYLPDGTFVNLDALLNGDLGAGRGIEGQRSDEDIRINEGNTRSKAYAG